MTHLVLNIIVRKGPEKSAVPLVAHIGHQCKELPVSGCATPSCKHVSGIVILNTMLPFSILRV